MFEIVWSGTLEREGKCGGLSGYYGPSQLMSQMPDIKIRDIATLTKPKRKYVKASGPTLTSLIEARLDDGWSLERTRKDTGASPRTVRKVAFRRAQQQAQLPFVLREAL
jgi:hypothetical protein